MKILTSLCSILLAAVFCATAFGQQSSAPKKQSFLGSLTTFLGKKKTDSLKTPTQSQQMNVDFRKECEQRNGIVSYQYEYDSFLKNTLFANFIQVPRFTLYNFGWGSVVFSNLKLDMYPDPHW